MPEDIPLLANVRIAAPCPANWNEMVGGDRVRYCRSCEKNVYNLSEMSQNDAEKLLKTHEGSLCVRYYRRTDGTIMTNNCPVGLRTIRKVYLKTAAGAAALFGVMFGGIASMGARKQEPEPQPEITVGGMERNPTPITVPPKQKDPEPEHLMGRVTAQFSSRVLEQKVEVLKKLMAQAEQTLNNKRHPVLTRERKGLQETIKIYKIEIAMNEQGISGAT